MSEEKELSERIAELEAESAERLAGWQRAKADYQNLKRESEERLLRTTVQVKMSLLREILPMYDHLKQATKTKPDKAHADSWIEGIIRVREQFDGLLSKWHIQPVPTVGREFDPRIHEAVQSDGEGEYVSQELQSGYVLDDELVYPAKVAVGKSGPTNPSNITEDPKH